MSLRSSYQASEFMGIFWISQLWSIEDREVPVRARIHVLELVPRKW